MRVEHAATLVVAAMDLEEVCTEILHSRFIVVIAVRKGHDTASNRVLEELGIKQAYSDALSLNA